jgi:hypothetical protein
MDPITGAAAIGAAGGVGSGIMNWRQADINRDFQRDMYHTQRKDALEDWHRTTEYNKPENQLKRIREAGLNPMLAYGKGISQQSAQPVRSSQAGTGSVARIDNPFAQIPATIAQAGQLKVNQQQLGLNKQLNDAKIMATIAGAIKDKALATDILVTLGYDIANIKSQTALNNARTHQSADMLTTQAQNRKVQLDKFELEASRLEKDWTQAYSQVMYNRAAGARALAQAETEPYRQKQLEASADYYANQAQLVQQKHAAQHMDNILKRAGFSPNGEFSAAIATTLFLNAQANGQIDKYGNINSSAVNDLIKKAQIIGKQMKGTTKFRDYREKSKFPTGAKY